AIYKARKEEKEKAKAQVPPEPKIQEIPVKPSKQSVHIPPAPMATPLIPEVAEEVPPNIAISKPLPIPQPPPPPPVEVPMPKKPTVHSINFNLDEYFDAKYKAKSKYMKRETPVPAPTPVVKAPVPSQEQLVQRSAKEEIQNRVQNEMLKMAMKNVFPSYYQ
ncbi:MAG TPA: hypothetical protein V6C58_20875, partial [Allocoleopsis sp.]